MKFIRGYTKRGFELLNFNDLYNELCDIQRSSLASQSAIWLGTHSPNPRVLIDGVGWTKYDLPDKTLINHRMHLSRKQSILLALKLLKFGLFNRL